ncbi:endonuclease III [Halodesulfurarchaeum formicicum]|uniref:Endonuclease III n=1 Tax=Halodesulfurarchaeum formicicum TaxID=1873524 RepID=A0A1D8S5D1_9EURY|nr:endonuclease III [Halodesulfurarchaeum formicicum]AOW80561.1 endonuclease III [Halodesulfurarchaeum formicicum]APE95900.1 endonuclease III [Halodesulfurarchaeum formicicum]
MTERSEPAHNIAAGTPAEEQPGGQEPETRAEAVVDRLGELFWRSTYGDQAAFESLVRTILSQNTSDQASQPAHDALLERFDGEGDLARALAEADREAIVSAIKSAGLYNQKSAVIQRTAEHVLDAYGSADAFDRYVREEDAVEVRDTLLTLKGVGPKTADCVLLFAGGRDGVFPVDTHVHRIYRRLGIAPPDADHEGVREVLEREVPPQKCGYGHTTSIQFGREYCTARDPVCLKDPAACPLFDRCDRVGVDLDAGTVTDPAETV